MLDSQQQITPGKRLLMWLSEMSDHIDMLFKLLPNSGEGNSLFIKCKGKTIFVVGGFVSIDMMPQTIYSDATQHIGRCGLGVVG